MYISYRKMDFHILIYSIGYKSIYTLAFNSSFDFSAVLLSVVGSRPLCPGNSIAGSLGGTQIQEAPFIRFFCCWVVALYLLGLSGAGVGIQAVRLRLDDEVYLLGRADLVQLGELRLAEAG